MSAQTPGRPTIRDVARHAGVSKSLVSLVLSNSPQVSKERRERVEHSIRELGYEMNLAARSLATTNNLTVGMLVSDLHNPWAFDVADAARTVLQESGHTVLFSAMSQKDEQGIDKSALQAFRDLRVVGLLVIGTVPDREPFARIAVGGQTVFIGGGPDYTDTADVVRVDDAAGIRMLVDHLVDAGHRRIVHLGGGSGSVAAAREAGYRQAMTGHGLDAGMRTIRSGFRMVDGQQAARELLATTGEEQLPTAIVCINDLAALGAMEVLDEHRLQVALTGYDNIGLAAMRRISLTTVDPDSAELGLRGAHTLLARLAEQSPPERFGQSLITPRLVIRQSSNVAP